MYPPEFHFWILFSLFKLVIWAAEVKIGAQDLPPVRETRPPTQHPHQNKSIKTASNQRSRRNQMGDGKKVAVEYVGQPGWSGSF